MIHVDVALVIVLKSVVNWSRNDEIW